MENYGVITYLKLSFDNGTTLELDNDTLCKMNSRRRRGLWMHPIYDISVQPKATSAELHNEDGARISFLDGDAQQVWIDIFQNVARFKAEQGRLER